MTLELDAVRSLALQNQAALQEDLRRTQAALVERDRALRDRAEELHYGAGNRGGGRENWEGAADETQGLASR